MFTRPGPQKLNSIKLIKIQKTHRYRTFSLLEPLLNVFLIKILGGKTVQIDALTTEIWSKSLIMTS